MPNLIRAELHSHSIYSDGSYAPATLAQMCHDVGVTVWSLTDHDNCHGCAEAADAAKRLGIEFIPGIEISAFADRSIHILGYGVDPESAAIVGYSTRRLQARRERMRLMVARLNEIGVEVSFDRVVTIAGQGAINRPHLAEAMVEVGAVASIDEAFDRFIGTGGPAYIETPWPTVPDAIELIGEAGGIAVLAHPGTNDRDHLIAEWVAAGLAGIEVRHPKHSAADEERYATMASNLGVFATASSDYHGPHHISQQHFGTVEVLESIIAALLP